MGLEEAGSSRKRGRHYPHIESGQWVKPVMRGYRMMCCDCGLVHRVDFKVIVWGRGHKVKLRAFRDAKATAASRRARKGRHGRP